MKFLRNLLIATTAVAAMSATAAFADATATYTDGTVAVTGVDTSVFGDQVTVIIVPDGTTTVSEGDIYYINQDDQTGITTILAGMGMKELAEGDPSDFEVWIGGTDVSETNPIIKIDFATATGEPIQLGDANLSGDVDVLDLTPIVDHILKVAEFEAGSKNFVAADANQSGDIDVLDLTPVVDHILKISTLGEVVYNG